MTEHSASSTPKSRVSRRAVVGAAAWTAPAIALSVASPAHATSGPVPTIAFLSVPPGVAPGETFGDVVIAATTDGTTPAPAGSIVTLQLGGGLTFPDGSTEKDFVATGTAASVTVTGIRSATGAAGSSNPIIALYSGSWAYAFLDVTGAAVAPAATGSVFAWGYNAEGAVGDGTATLRKTPVAWLGGRKYNSIYGGYQHFAAVAADGTVWMTGTNTHAPFGNGKTTGNTTKSGPAGPALNASRTGPFTDAARVVKTQAMFDETTWIHGTDGRIYTAGENSADMFSLKDGSKWDTYDNGYTGMTPVGTQILNANPGKTILWASGNGWFRAAYLLSDGTVWNSGSNRFYGMGNGGTLNTQYLAAQTITTTGEPLSNIVQVRVTQDSTMYLDGDGNLWGAGQNTKGQLPGVGAVGAIAARATRLTQPAGKKVMEIWANSSDHESFFAKTTDGMVYAVGRNLSGSNGVGHTRASENVWEQVRLPAGKDIAEIAGGGDGNLFRMTDGSVYFAGLNDTGGPGTGVTSGATTTMTQVPLARPAIGIACTWYDTYAAILAD